MPTLPHEIAKTVAGLRDRINHEAWEDGAALTDWNADIYRFHGAVASGVLPLPEDIHHVALAASLRAYITLHLTEATLWEERQQALAMLRMMVDSGHYPTLMTGHLYIRMGQLEQAGGIIVAAASNHYRALNILAAMYPADAAVATLLIAWCQLQRRSYLPATADAKAARQYLRRAISSKQLAEGHAYSLKAVSHLWESAAYGCEVMARRKHRLLHRLLAVYHLLRARYLDSRVEDADPLNIPYVEPLSKGK